MKRTLVYIIAAVIAIALACGLFLMLRSQTAEQPVPGTEPLETPAPIEMVEVIVANERIPANTEITPSMLRTKAIPAAEKPFFALSNANEAIGATANVMVEEETVLLSSMIELPRVYIADGQGLSYEIPEGFVGLAIPAADLEGMAGYLIPGDVINILADAKAVKAAMDGVPYIEGDVLPLTKAYLVKNVTVLAVGDKAYDEMMATDALALREAKKETASREDENEEEAGDISYDCVIIALDDFSAQLVVETMQSSKLTFALQHRSYGVHEVTLPELVPVPQEFTYLTEEEFRKSN